MFERAKLCTGGNNLAVSSIVPPNLCSNAEASSVAFTLCCGISGRNVISDAKKKNIPTNQIFPHSNWKGYQKNIKSFYFPLLLLLKQFYISPFVLTIFLWFFPINIKLFLISEESSWLSWQNLHRSWFAEPEIKDKKSITVISLWILLIQL